MDRPEGVFRDFLASYAAADEIAESEGADDREERWSVVLDPIDAIAIGDRHVFGPAHADASLVFHGDDTTGTEDAAKGFLLEARDGRSLIRRSLWNVEPSG